MLKHFFSNILNKAGSFSFSFKKRIICSCILDTYQTKEYAAPRWQLGFASSDQTVHCSAIVLWWSRIIQLSCDTVYSRQVTSWRHCCVLYLPKNKQLCFSPLGIKEAFYTFIFNIKSNHNYYSVRSYFPWCSLYLQQEILLSASTSML